MCVYIYIYICIYIYIYIYLRPPTLSITRKGTNGVSTDGVTAKNVLFEVFFLVLPLT